MMILTPAQEKGRVCVPGLHQKPQCNHNLRFHQAQQDFLEAMAAAGIAPADPKVIIADGELHRFRVAGDKRGSRNGYFTLRLDGIPAGHFGSWKHGVSGNWCAVDKSRLTPAQRDEQRRRINAARQAAVAELDRRHREAAEKASYLLSKAKPAPADFSYLVNKGIQPGIARVRGDVLVLPVTDVDGNMRSLQFIGEDGSKRFLSGGMKKSCFILVQSPEKPARTLIAEGFATAQTLAGIELQARVIAALDAGNLESVALAVRAKHPTADIVIASDFDAVGRAKGEQAARAVGAKVLPPPENIPDWCTDWNDYAALMAGGAR